MAIFLIGGKEIVAHSKAAAIAIFAQTLKVEEVKEKRDQRLEKLNLPEYIKDYIEKDRDIAEIHSPFLIISLSNDREISVLGYKTEKALDKALRELYAEPEGSGWAVEYIIKNDTTYSVKAHVTIEYQEITHSLKEE